MSRNVRGIHLMKSGMFASVWLLAILIMPLSVQAQEEISIGIGTQNTTTNTVTGGVVLKELKLLEKHLPRTGKYKNVKYKIDWQN
ncbi:MAG: hypothetical protein ACK44V_07045, partial [Burkholderiales bacterium]